MKAPIRINSGTTDNWYERPVSSTVWLTRVRGKVLPASGFCRKAGCEQIDGDVRVLLGNDRQAGKDNEGQEHFRDFESALQWGGKDVAADDVHDGNGHHGEHHERRPGTDQAIKQGAAGWRGIGFF